MDRPSAVKTTKENSCLAPTTMLIRICNRFSLVRKSASSGNLASRERSEQIFHGRNPAPNPLPSLSVRIDLDRRGADRARQDPAPGKYPGLRLDFGRGPRDGHVVQAGMGPGGRDQPHLPAGRRRAADRRQERRRRGADAVRHFAGRALSEDRARRGQRGPQGAAGVAQRYRTPEENGAAEHARQRQWKPQAVTRLRASTKNYHAVSCMVGMHRHIRFEPITAFDRKEPRMTHPAMSPNHVAVDHRRRVRHRPCRRDAVRPPRHEGLYCRSRRRPAGGGRNKTVVVAPAAAPMS